MYQVVCGGSRARASIETGRMGVTGCQTESAKWAFFHAKNQGVDKSLTLCEYVQTMVFSACGCLSGPFPALFRSAPLRFAPFLEHPHLRSTKLLQQPDLPRLTSRSISGSLTAAWVGLHRAWRSQIGLVRHLRVIGSGLVAWVRLSCVHVVVSAGK